MVFLARVAALRQSLSTLHRFTVMAPPQQGGRHIRRASVMVPLCVYNGIPSLLFTKRSEGLRSHKGQVSFPGGLVERRDLDPTNASDSSASAESVHVSDDAYIRAALREMEEEVGVSQKYLEVLGLHHDCKTFAARAQSSPSKQHDKPAPSVPHNDRQSVITPVVGCIAADIASLHFECNPREVDFAFTVPLDALAKEELWTTFNSTPSFRFTLRPSVHNDTFVCHSMRSGSSSTSSATFGEQQLQQQQQQHLSVHIWGATAWITRQVLKTWLLTK